MNGNVTLGANNALAPTAASTITLTNGTITNNLTGTYTTLIIPNAVTFNAAVSTVTFAGGSANPILITGAGTTTAAGTTNLTVAANTTLTIGTAATVGSSNITAAGSLNKFGTGTLAIATGNTSTSPITTILGGIVVAQATNALGTTTPKLIVSNGTTLEIQQITTAAVAIPASAFAVIGSGATGTTGAIEMLGGGNGANTGARHDVPGRHDHRRGHRVVDNQRRHRRRGGPEQGGLGFLNLTSANTYNGTTTVSNGVINAGASTAFGAVTAGVVVASGATVQVGAAFTILRPLSNTGTGTGDGYVNVGAAPGFVEPRGFLQASALRGSGAATLP